MLEIYQSTEMTAKFFTLSEKLNRF